ncbi:MAG: hypothetical protein M3P04_03525, partial [Actinomycetota bacterium]|nr:hypothetical protein [Actinomycetota bacterium]
MRVLVLVMSGFAIAGVAAAPGTLAAEDVHPEVRLTFSGALTATLTGFGPPRGGTASSCNLVREHITDSGQFGLSLSLLGTGALKDYLIDVQVPGDARGTIPMKDATNQAAHASLGKPEIDPQSGTPVWLEAWTSMADRPSGSITVHPDLKTVDVDVIEYDTQGSGAAPVHVVGTVVCDPVDALVVPPIALPTASVVPTPAVASGQESPQVLASHGTSPAERAGFVGTKKVRSSLAAAVRTPQEVSWKLNTVAVSALLALAMLLVVFPAQLFNATLEENYDEVVGWLPWRGSGSRRRVPPLVALGAVALATALLSQLLDPHMRVDTATTTAVVGVTLAIVITTLLCGAPGRLLLQRRYHTGALLRAYPAALVVAVACVAVSRSVGFEPGYLYGIVGGFVVAAAPTARDAGRSASLGVVVGLAVAAAAWVAHGPVADQAVRGAAGWLVADTLLAAVFSGALGGLIFGLVPLRFLTGATILRWSKGVWAAFFALAVFG